MRVGIALFALWAVAAAAEDRIIIEAKVNGRPVRLALDTGAEWHVLFAGAAERLGIKVTPPPKDAEAQPGRVKMGVTEKLRLEIGGKSTEGVFAVLEVPSYLRADCDGVLSWRGFSGNLLEIRWDRREAHALTELPSYLAECVQAHVPPKGPIMGFSVPGGREKDRVVYVDTGSPLGVELSEERWKQWLREHPDRPSTLEADYSPAAGLTVSRVYWAERLAFGQLVLCGVPVRQAKPAFERGLPGLEAVLGLFALTRLDMICDRKNDRIYLRPNPNAQARYPQNRLGAVFTPRDPDSDHLVAHVVDGSPAHKAGVRNGDVLQRIDDLDATKWRTDPRVLPLSRFWSRPAGTRLSLSLLRDGKLFEAAPVLKDILGIDGKAPPSSGPR